MSKRNAHNELKKISKFANPGPS